MASSEGGGGVVEVDSRGRVQKVEVEEKKEVEREKQ